MARFVARRNTAGHFCCLLGILGTIVSGTNAAVVGNAMMLGTVLSMVTRMVPLGCAFVPLSQRMLLRNRQPSGLTLETISCSRPKTFRELGGNAARMQGCSSRISSLQSAANANESANSENEKEEKNAGSSFRRRNQQWVVLVDDEESIRYAVGDYLYDCGYEVTACADAASLLDLIASKNNNKENAQQQQYRLPDVIVSDVRMPESDKNGYELVEFLRSADRWIVDSSSSEQLLQHQQFLQSLKSVPIVLLTAKAMTKDRIRGYRAGADVVLPKPFSPEELVSILDGLIERRQQRLRPRGSGSSSTSGGGSSSEELRSLKRDLDEIKAMVQYNAAHTVQKTDVVLNDKERFLVERIAEGYTLREIARAIRPIGMPSDNDKPVAPGELESLRESMADLCQKCTGTDSKTELIRWAKRVGYVAE